MTDPTVFDTSPAGTPAPIAPVGNPAPAPVVKEGVLEDLVGEGKKFKTTEDLARGKVESDSYIARLEEEQRGLREDLAKNIGVEETLAQLRKELRDTADKPKDDTRPELTAANIAELVKESVTVLEQAKTANQNVIAANSGLVKHFGSEEKARENFIARSQELGMTPDAMKAIAEQSPTAFSRLMGLDATPVKSVDPLDTNKSDVNPAVDITQNVAEGTKAYFDAIRKSDKRLYWTPAVQNRIYEARKNGTYVI